MKKKGLICDFLYRTVFNGCLILFFLLVVGLSGCSDAEKEEEKYVPEQVVLTVDKNILKSDSLDFTTFIVMADEVDVSKVAVILSKTEGNTPLPDHTFASNVPGIYTFYAIYEGVVSAEIEVQVIPVQLSLHADTTKMKANGKSNITFSVLRDGKDVTEDAEIIGEDTDIAFVLEGNTFTTTTAGVFKFYSTHKELISDTIEIEAFPLTLTLVSDTTTIKANGKNAVTFKVLLEEDDVTEKATIYRREGENSVPLENGVFTTEKEGQYEFFARYEEKTTNTVTIEALVSNLIITADKAAVRTGESVTFTAISDNEQDVSSAIELYITKNNQEETIIKGNVFTPSSFGVYSIYATYDDKKSNAIEIKVSAATVALSVDKTELKATGKDTARFVVLVDGVSIDSAQIYVKKNGGNEKIEGYSYATHFAGNYTFYTQFDGIRSNDVSLSFSQVPFYKQSCAMEIVATWCGYSPSMIRVFQQVHEQLSDQVLIVSFHRASSGLKSSAINAEGIMEHFNRTGIPYGIMDWDRVLMRNIKDIESTYKDLKQKNPVTAGIAVSSQKFADRMDITLKVLVNETNEYSVCAIVVEDDIVKKQTIYEGDQTIYDNQFVHSGVATYIMPETNAYTGKSLGVVESGKEKTESFSISLAKSVTSERTVNFANCRVVAYVMKKVNGVYYINNAISCPINGSVDYQYQ